MYEVRKGDAVVALTEKPNFIYQHPDGYFVLCEQERAQGVAVDGTAYHLSGKPEMEGCETVLLVEKDTGNIIKDAEAVNAITFVTLAEAGNIDDVTAGEHTELFTPWAYPVSYTTGQMRQHGEKLYRCISDHTSQVDWAPDAAVSLWVNVSDPAEEWPAWSQPVGAQDAYAAGAKVSHNDKHWTSDVDANVWEPGVYGWTEAVEE